jgi:hypothetical protein
LKVTSPCQVIRGKSANLVFNQEKRIPEFLGLLEPVHPESVFVQIQNRLSVARKNKTGEVTVSRLLCVSVAMHINNTNTIEVKALEVLAGGEG